MEETKGRGEVVCVTGASGFIGSCLVSLLLHRGYSVHATVQRLDNPKETEHLIALASGSADRLTLFSADLLDAEALAAAIRGTSGVFHVASPCIVDRVQDPKAELVDPAVQGTINVLRSAKDSGIHRVVVTSSISAMFPNPCWPADEVIDESCKLDLDYCRKHELWYPESKALAEEAAWEFAKQSGLDVVVVNPGTVMGPIIPSAVNASMGMLLRLLEGCTEEYANFFIGPVHVEDVALAHVLLYENPAASGRHLCIANISHWSDFAAKVAELFPQYKVPRFANDTQPGLMRAEIPAKKLMALGMQFKPVEKIVEDAVESLKCKGFIE